MIDNIQSIKKRYDNFDLLKFMAIFFVIIYHFYEVPINAFQVNDPVVYLNYFFSGLLSVCVPIFFFVNGALLINKKTDIKKHIRKILRIMVLTWFWSFVTMVTLSYIRHGNMTLQEFIKSIWVFKEGWNDHLWFLQTLVIIYLFSPLLILAFHTQRSIFYFFFAVVIVLTFGSRLFEMISDCFWFVNHKRLNIFTALLDGFNAFRGIFGFAIGYFILGGILFQYKDKLYKYKTIATIIIPLIMILSGLYGYMMSVANNAVYDTVWYGYNTLFTLILVVAIFILTLNYIHTGILGKFIRIVAENSLGIYFLHRIVGYFLLTGYLKFIFSTSLILNILFSMIILLLSTSICLLLKKIPYLKYVFSI